jgi:hypothetical protein
MKNLLNITRDTMIAKYSTWDWGHGVVAEAFTTLVRGPEFRSPKPTQIKNPECTSVTPVFLWQNARHKQDNLLKLMGQFACHLQG